VPMAQVCLGPPEASCRSYTTARLTMPRAQPPDILSFSFPDALAETQYPGGGLVAGSQGASAGPPNSNSALRAAARGAESAVHPSDLDDIVPPDPQSQASQLGPVAESADRSPAAAAAAAVTASGCPPQFLLSLTLPPDTEAPPSQRPQRQVLPSFGQPPMDAEGELPTPQAGGDWRVHEASAELVDEPPARVDRDPDDTLSPARPASLPVPRASKRGRPSSQAAPAAGAGLPAVPLAAGAALAATGPAAPNEVIEYADPIEDIPPPPPTLTKKRRSGGIEPSAPPPAAPQQLVFASQAEPPVSQAVPQAAANASQAAVAPVAAQSASSAAHPPEAAADGVKSSQAEPAVASSARGRESADSCRPETQLPAPDSLGSECTPIPAPEPGPNGPAAQPPGNAAARARRPKDGKLADLLRAITRRGDKEPSPPFAESEAVVASSPPAPPALSMPQDTCDPDAGRPCLVLRPWASMAPAQSQEQGPVEPSQNEHGDGAAPQAAEVAPGSSLCAPRSPSHAQAADESQARRPSPAASAPAVQPPCESQPPMSDVPCGQPELTQAPARPAVQREDGSALMPPPCPRAFSQPHRAHSAPQPSRPLEHPGESPVLGSQAPPAPAERRNLRLRARTQLTQSQL
jgi:hypothetical protein